MLKRLKWISYGAVLAAMAISGGSLFVESRRERAESLRREGERLARENAMLALRAEELERQGRELTKIVERLNVERRVAQVEVVQQHLDEFGRVAQTIIRMVELDRDGRPLPAQVFGVAGRIPHFDALVIKFGEDFVTQGDQLRGHSLALFRRVYGETQAPESGYWLGRRGDIPDVYRTSAAPTEFEINLWRDFWKYAADPYFARAHGVRVAQGEAVYAPMSVGEQWLLTLEADGGLNLFKQEGRFATSSPADQQRRPSARTADAAPRTQTDSRLHAPPPKDGATVP